MPAASHSTRHDTLNVLGDLIQQKLGKVSDGQLRQITAALKQTEIDPERFALELLAMMDKRNQTRAIEGSGLGKIISIEEGRAALDAITVEDDSTVWAESELLGAGATAARIGVARTSLDNWRQKHKVLAFKKGLRNYVYPVRQFQRQRPVEGIDQVRSHFPSDEGAWTWLVTPNPYTNGLAPIDWLTEGKINDVVRAAEGACDYQ